MRSKLTRNYLPEVVALGTNRSKPRMVTVNLTDRCNQHCVYCEIGQHIATGRTQRLTLADMKWILDEMACHHIPKISLCGGEPFLFDGLSEVVDYAYSKGIRCSITTNGMTGFMLSDVDLGILKKTHTEINLSIDSFDEKINTHTRGTPTALQNALRSAEKFSEYGIPVTVLTVITKYNYHHLLEFFTTACEKGIKQVLFQPVITSSNYADRGVIDEKSLHNVEPGHMDALMDQLSGILKFERNHKISTNVYRFYPWIRYYLETAAGNDHTWFFDRVLNKFYCREIDAIIDINYDGGIQPCGLAMSEISICENHEKGLMELWNAATAQIKQDIHKGNYYDICNSCCHHFSRNMLASVMRFPVRNRRALLKLAPLLASRVYGRTMKKINL